MKELNLAEVEMVNGAGWFGAITGAAIGGLAGLSYGPAGAVAGALTGAVIGHCVEELKSKK